MMGTEQLFGNPVKKLIRFLNWLHIEKMDDDKWGLHKFMEEVNKEYPGPLLPLVAPLREIGCDPANIPDIGVKVKEIVDWHRGEGQYQGKGLWQWMEAHKTKHVVGTAPDLEMPPDASGSAVKKLNAILEWWEGNSANCKGGAYHWFYEHDRARTGGMGGNAPPPPPEPLGAGLNE